MSLYQEMNSQTQFPQQIKQFKAMINNPQFISRLKSMYAIYKNNPNELINQLAKNNPNIINILRTINNPQQEFNSILNSCGMSMNDFARILS